MKVVFITAFQPFVSRNVLNTGVLDEFLTRGVQVVVLVPKAKADFYTKVYSPRGVIVEGIDVASFNTQRERFFQHTAELLIDTNTKRFHKMIERFEGGSLLKYILMRTITATVGRLRGAKHLFRFIEYYFYQPRFFEALLHSYKPDAVFATNVFGELDTALIKDARRSGVRSVGMVMSWDNPTSKQLLRVVPDTLLAHNQGICAELSDLHAVEDAKAVGTPHYDYAKSYCAVTKEEFFEQMGIPQDRTLVLLSPAGQKFIDTDWQIFQILKDARSTGAFSRPVHFLVRVHPTNKINFGQFVPDEFFTIEEPGVRFEGVRDKDNELDMAGFNHLLDSIDHSTVVVNTLSSIVIDACVRNRPVVTVGFDGLETHVPFERSVELYHVEENMAKLLTTGGAPVARSAPELVAAIERYIQDSSRDSVEREVLLVQQCSVLDGHAKDRIVDAVFGRLSAEN